MARQLNLSINELWSLLTRTFEALYGHERDYYDMARTALWLECHGHDGVKQLIEALPTLEEIDLAKPSFIQKAPTHIVINGGGHSLFCIGRSIADLAMALASTHDIAQLEITNIKDSQPLIGVLSYIASHNFSAVIKGEDMQAIISPSAVCPIIYSGGHPDILSLICSKSENSLNKELALGSKIIKNKETQMEIYSLRLDRGINIQRSHYERLTNIANRVLVEATEASRRGAGE